MWALMHRSTFLGDPFLSALGFRDSARCFFLLDQRSMQRGPWNKSLLTPLLGPSIPGPGQYLNATKASTDVYPLLRDARDHR